MKKNGNHVNTAAPDLEVYLPSLIERLGRDEALMKTHSAELSALIRNARKAVEARNFKRIGYFADRLSEWLANDYEARVKLVDTISIMKLVSELYALMNGEGGTG